jgi:hypothetical protein
MSIILLKNSHKAHARFTVTVFESHRACSTLPFCFQLKKEKGENKKSKSCTIRTRQKHAPVNRAQSYVNIRWHYATPRGAAV